MTALRVLPSYASALSKCLCDFCSLQGRKQSLCPPQIPRNFNGLMLVGEGPGKNEAQLKVPFIGRSGQLLDKMLEKVGLARSECWVTNATLCMPPPGEKYEEARKGGKPQSFTDLHPHAVPACRPRLLDEIDFVQPRVIVALGQAALLTLTGRVREKVKRLPRPKCELCLGELTLPVWACPCGAEHFLPAGHGGWCGLTCEQRCGLCGWTGVVTVGVRKKRCPTCLGKKTQELKSWPMHTPFGVMSTSGVVFRGLYAPDRDNCPPEARLDLPCHYLIPSYHPAFLDRDPPKKSSGRKAPGGQFLVNAALAHFAKAARLLVEDAAWHFSYAVVHPTDPSEPVASLDELAALLYSGHVVSVDIETDNEEPWLVTTIDCIGFSSTELGAAITVNTEGLSPGHPTIQLILRWLADTRYPKVLQHGIYDTQVIWHIWKGECGGYIGDTMLAHNAVCPDEPHKLQHLAGFYTDSPPWKPVREKDGKQVFESPMERRAYNARDAWNTILIWRKEERHLEAEQARFVHDLDVAMVHCAREMERAGLPVSKDRWETWRARSEHYRDRALESMYGFLGSRDFNPGSQPHLKYALFSPGGPCGLVPAKYTEPSPTHPQGQPSTAKTALLAYKGHPFVDALLDYRRWNGVLGTYFEGMALSSDYRLRVSWNPIGARTGRWSTSPNVQNWFKEILIYCGEGASIFEADREAHSQREDPNERWFRRPGIRELIVAPQGRKIVGADLSQAELRVLAALSGDARMIELCSKADEARKLEPEWDPHSYVASIAFGNTFLQANKEQRKRLRDLIKRVIYGLNYGAGPETILESIYDGGYEGPPITEDDIIRITKAYFRAFPNVREWRESTREKAQRTGRVTDALIGRRREFPLKRVDSTIAYNFSIQSTVGSMMNLSLRELRQVLPRVDPSAFILAQVHDAIYVEANEQRAEDVAQVLTACMSQRLVLVKGAAPMDFPATAHVADDWYHAA